MLHGNYDNSLRLLRLIIRRERLTSVVWVIILVLFSAAIAPAMAEMFSETETRSQFAASVNNPIMVSMMGPIYGIDNYTPGAMYGGMMLLWYIIAVAIMNIFFVVRHTRADEEYGRAEVVRSLPTGRLANVNATMISALILNAVVALFTGLGIAATGVESMDLGGSLLYGAAAGAAGLVFAAIAALFSQLSSNKSGASGLSLLSLFAFYMLRAVGDVQGNEIISCISPLGLVQRTQAYIENNIWPTLLLLLTAVVISAAAYKLNSIRDLGQGFIAARRGRAAAPAGLLSPFGLAWRLLRFMLLIWTVMMFVLAASYGSVIADISTFVGDSPEYMTIIGVPVDMLDKIPAADQEKLIVDSFGTFVTLMMTLVCIVPLLNAALRVRTEEREGRAEHIMARVVPRWKYLAGYVAIAYATSIVIQFATASGLYYSAAALTGDANPFTFSGLLEEYFAYLPALWVMIGVAVFIVGLFPKATGAVWGYFGVVCFTSFVGSLVLPEWLLKVSPLHFIPQPQPFEQFTLDFTPLIVLTVIAAVLTAAGFIFYTKRDTVS